MEDEYVTNQNGSFCSVFDGHGGSAVSKYLRQNLYARYLQAKATTMVSSIMEGNEYDSDTDNNNDTGETGDTNLSSREADDSSSDLEEDMGAGAGMSDPKKILSENLSNKNGIATPPSNLSLLSNKPFDEMKSRSLKTCMRALKSAFEKIDAEVQRVSHWSFQGSTAVAVKLHKIASSKKTVLISANVGDSRAVLCRSGKAIDLTKDHKPNDPEERERVESLGGRVEWFGPVDEEGRPVSGKRKTKNGISHGFSGVYRINRNLALSRAIGDRSELPFVSSQVDIQQIELDDENDEYVILASDGLWDVFHNSQEAIDLCQTILQRSGNSANNEQNGERMEKIRRKMSKVLVREALRRGSMDNITVIIIWLSP
jgi:serine/threonine protein phosphatase PrpC